MIARITDKQLDALCARLNEVTNSPPTPWTRQTDGTLKANIGNYHISGAYGGVCVHRMMNEDGGVTTPISYGHIPRRELFGLLRAYIDGIDFAKREE